MREFLNWLMIQLVPFFKLRKSPFFILRPFLLFIKCYESRGKHVPIQFKNFILIKKKVNVLAMTVAKIQKWKTTSAAGRTVILVVVEKCPWTMI